ncbi:MAG TPA: carboxypeptidase-like regulatory domain-containing protein [Candidatus Solibacter sp.]|nr:carboxypeptidase-like regulatory domain-containing protein [Candidatus Solibacter sp.]
MGFSRLVCATALMAAAAFAQETRSMIFGRALDPQGSAVVGVAVTVRNDDTNVALRFTTNETGYYEANLLLPGNYSVEAEAAGFKKMVRRGVTLQVASRIEVDLKMEVGGVTETVSVTAEAPLLETNNVTSGRVLDNKSVMELPVMGNSAITLVRLTPGMQTGGVNNYLALHSNLGGSDYQVDGNVGGNSWTLDGSPNIGPTRRVAYLPYTDAVSEFKVETNNFDASVGQSTGAAITMVSRSGSNQLHGTATWQHWQQRWQGTPFFVKQQYYNAISRAEILGNHTLAEQLRNTDKQPTGRSNNWGASGGGPVFIPKVYNGKNRLFWFFTYNAFKDIKNEDPSTFNRTVPTVGARGGDFSDMLALPNSAQYTIYDPTTVAADPARATHYIRTPFPGNIIPKNRFVSPVYDAVTKLFPLPNQAIAPGQAPTNNYLASKTPYNWDYKAFSNRIDYQISSKLRMLGRWSYNNFSPEDRGDWTYETARGLNVGGLVRNNKGGNIDMVYTQNASWVWDFNVGLNQFREGNVQPYALSLKPSDINLPKYLDDKAGADHLLPLNNIGGYSQNGPGGTSNWIRYRIFTMKLAVTHVRGSHTFQASFEPRYAFRTALPSGNTSGNFGYGTNYVRKDDDGNTPNNNLGLAWASFILGIPNSMQIQTLDSYAMLTPYYGGFVQDSWRVTRRLTLNLGLRAEYELGSTERYNRFIAGYDFNAKLPITDAAQAAYAAAPLAELPASQFKVLGGPIYPGVNGAPRNLVQNQLMWLPRLAAAFQINEKTVLRGGYGIYYDTNNVLNFGPDQSGYTQTTSTQIMLDPLTWNPLFGANSPANFKSPLNDPFPVRADGTRFTVPTQNALGLMAKSGRGFGFTDFSQEHARQQRWRVSLQRQIFRDLAIDVAYSGSWSDRISIGHRLDILPEKYWADGQVRADALNTDLTSNVANPFRLANFASLAQSSPLIYNDMSQQGLFTSTTIRKSTLLRAFPQQNGGSLTNNTTPAGGANTHEFDLNLTKRFSHGVNFSLGWTALHVRERNFYFNEFDADPSWRTSNNGRPQRVVGTVVYEMPFGRGRHFGRSWSRPLDFLLGGWQTAFTYEYQPGPLLDWGNVFYFGDTKNILNIDKSFDRWFNTAGCVSSNPGPGDIVVAAGQPCTQGFEKRSAMVPNGANRRVFPVRIPDLRADKTSQWNGNLAKNMHINERVNFQMRLDALNIQNRSQMANPSTDPTSTNFGRTTSQTSATNRWLQVQARITF